MVVWKDVVAGEYDNTRTLAADTTNRFPGGILLGCVGTRARIVDINLEKALLLSVTLKSTGEAGMRVDPRTLARLSHFSNNTSVSS
jgi:hypothetical protein